MLSKSKIISSSESYNIKSILIHSYISYVFLIAKDDSFQGYSLTYQFLIFSNQTLQVWIQDAVLSESQDFFRGGKVLHFLLHCIGGRNF